MRVIYLHQFFIFPDEAGGTRSYDLSVGFVSSGLSVEVITTTSNKNLKTNKRWHKVVKDNITVHYIYLPYHNSLSYLKRSIVFIQFLWFSTFKILSLKGDIVLATSTPLTIGIPALVKKWLHRTPFIFEVRDVWPEAVIAIGAIRNKILIKLLYFLEKTIYNNAVALVTLSSDMKRSIVSRYPNLEKKKPVVIIENIAEIDRFQKNYENGQGYLNQVLGFTPKFSVLYAGTFGKVNGLTYVIELAYKLLNANPDVIFILIGNGAEKESIRALAQTKGILGKNLFILDSVSKSDLPLLYQECHMGSSFVIPIKELWANSANKFFDTLAAGKPILINHSGWQADAINTESIGYVLSPKLTDDDILDFCSYIKNQSLYDQQCRNSFNAAQNQYSLKIAISKYINIFTQIKK